MPRYNFEEDIQLQMQAAGWQDYNEAKKHLLKSKKEGIKLMKIRAKRNINIGGINKIIEGEVFELIPSDFGIEIVVNKQYVSPYAFDGEMSDNFELV